MRLAVLGDPVGEAAKAPGLGLDDRSAIVGEDLGGVFRERIDLGLGEVLTREENMLVKRHVVFSSVGRLLTPHRADAPPAVVSKQYGRDGRADTPVRGPLPQPRQNGKSGAWRRI